MCDFFQKFAQHTFFLSSLFFESQNFAIILLYFVFTGSRNAQAGAKCCFTSAFACQIHFGLLGNTNCKWLCVCCQETDVLCGLTRRLLRSCGCCPFQPTGARVFFCWECIASSLRAFFFNNTSKRCPTTFTTRPGK